MYATKLIEKLQGMIENYGDMQVKIVPFTNKLIEDFDVYYGDEDYVLDGGELVSTSLGGQTLGDSHVIILDEPGGCLLPF